MKGRQIQRCCEKEGLKAHMEQFGVLNDDFRLNSFPHKAQIHTGTLPEARESLWRFRSPGSQLQAWNLLLGDAHGDFVSWLDHLAIEMH